MTNANTDALDAPVKGTGRRRRGPFAEVIFRLSRSPLAMFGLAVILLLIFCAIFADVLAPYDFAKQDLMHMFETPSAEHWLDTDEFGRDILSRLIESRPGRAAGLRSSSSTSTGPVPASMGGSASAPSGSSPASTRLARARAAGPSRSGAKR